ncbi:10376_t:CDS:2 [Rhizophagus irregularis]|nr:10376_t:CDS:2 [Rhizophagus irregularis]
MFRNRFTSYSYRQNYIRRPQSKSTDNKKDTKINEDVTIYELPNEEDYGEKVNYELYELSNNESYILSNEKVDYKLPIEEVDDKISNDCEMSNEIQKELFEEEPFNKESFEELFDNNEYFKIYNCGDFVVYKETVSKIGRILAIVEMHGELKIIIQRVLRFDELPKNLQSNDRRKRSHIEVWLQDTRQICSMSVVDTSSTVHFVHCCHDDECNSGEHDFGNNLYMRNIYFFKAI